MVDSTDLAQVLHEAHDIARSVAQKPTSAHVLLALFTVENRAQLLLKEKGVDEDALLQLITEAPAETGNVVQELTARARELASTFRAGEADCLHLLIAIIRKRCAASDLLGRTGLDLISLSNTALAYSTSGGLPRRLQPGYGQAVATRAPVSRPVGAPPSPLPSSTFALSVPRPAPAPAPVMTPPVTTPPPAARTTPALSPRDLIDVDEDDVTQDAVSEAPPPPMPRMAPPAPPAPVARATPPAPQPPAPVVKPSAPPPSQAKGQPLTLDAKAFPMLTSMGRNLSQAAREGKLDPVVGRAREVEEVIDILGKRRTNNPCLLGEPGVGKTAVVEGVAQRLMGLRGTLAEKILIELDMATLVAGTQLRGSFSEKLNALKEEVRRGEGRVVVFIDEIHTLVGAGSTGEGPQDAANELKTAMARGEFPCIGATTHDEYRKFIAADPALERRFTPVVVNEPSVPETVQILQGIIGRYEEHHALRYLPEALEAAASLASRYVTDRFMPDKAISVVDLAGSRCHREGKHRVDAADVARVVAKLAGVPEERLLMNDSARLLRLENDLAERVIGHGDAVVRISRVIRRNYAGFASRRPMGSFLFLGPTGVGKTEMARALAEVLFGNRDALVRLDMSEMSESHGVSRLIGSPAGYVGFGEGGQLTEPVRRRPSSVVVLDEIEKAHREVQMLLLQVLEEGRLTDGKGRHIDFSNTVIVMTTNLGAEAFSRTGRAVGFGAADAAEGKALDMASDTARKALPPELWNRIDERLPFRPLAEQEVAKIATLILAESSKRLATERGIVYTAGTDVVGHLLKSGGFDPMLGARPMRQVVQRLVEGPLAERILSGEFGAGDRVRVAVQAGQLQFARDAA
ncbi:ATP-dependent Clp protease ATP-binding subunit [Corallococcus sp. AB004]|uniref:AAA family ATPase n=1 Tax=Corallococcus exiguus TaxID=83462 RepID=UPI000EA1EA49|nr:ATP-dependent Clp protease ATP-binding subunit [Corallococcus exiguus]NPD28075.1 ATP-dependent Clp protease ATP-binding subunit [Corallococcus exiguus]RKI36214.1 ATP-dependent Clp protease ATP-binding subunit [Corallococcus sp. AB004]